MTDLSPAAAAVLDAYWASPWDPSLQQEDRYAIAAALRALVGANAYEVEGEGWYSLVIDVDDIYAIAAELEGAE
jgi:hypothetical protein